MHFYAKCIRKPETEGISQIEVIGLHLHRPSYASLLQTCQAMSCGCNHDE